MRQSKLVVLIAALLASMALSVACGGDKAETKTAKPTETAKPAEKPAEAAKPAEAPAEKPVEAAAPAPAAAPAAPKEGSGSGW